MSDVGDRIQNLILVLRTGKYWWPRPIFKTAKSVTNIYICRQHISNNRHQHQCGQMIFTVPVISIAAVELQAILTVETSLDVDVQLLNP